MKVLITGVAGFIGSHLAEKLLEQGYEVYGVDNFDDFYSKDIKLGNLRHAKSNPSFTFIELDITAKDAFSKLNNLHFDLVFHLAAKAGVRPSIKAPDQYLKTNIEGTLNVLNYMKANNLSRLVFASSSSIYGNCKIIPFVEDSITDEPISPYAFSKKSCELMNYCHHHLYNINIINLRFFTVYGPRQRPDLAIHKFVNKIYNNIPIEIYGDGSFARDFTYIDDIINGVVRSGEYLLKNTNIYETINLGNNSPIKVIELIDKIKNVVNRDFKVVHLSEQEGDVEITYANIDKAAKLLGYTPSTTFDVGLKKFVDWYKQHQLILSATI